jgi:hypothetical protein
MVSGLQNLGDGGETAARGECRCQRARWTLGQRAVRDESADVNTQGGGHGNMLQVACWGGHLEVVKELLDKDVEVNAQGGGYGDALQAACSPGHSEVIDLLNAKGAIMSC